MVERLKRWNWNYSLELELLNRVYVFGVRELTQSAVEIEAIRVKYADEYRHLMAELKWNDGRRKTQVMSLSGKCHNNDDDVVVDVDI